MIPPHFWTDQVFVFRHLLIFMPPFEKGGAYCFAHVGRYVGMSVGRYVGRSVCRYPLTLCNL